MNCTTFDELLNKEYGSIGTPERMKFEADAEAFCLAETLKEQRRLAGLTQQELADKIGTKKSYISKLENGHADVQLSTLFRIFAGLGKRVSVAILWPGVSVGGSAGGTLWGSAQPTLPPSHILYTKAIQEIGLSVGLFWE